MKNLNQKNKKILLIGTYPISNPIHGGQIRVGAIYNEYNKIFKEVIYTSVYLENPSYTTNSKFDFKLKDLSQKQKDILNDSYYLGDVVCGYSFIENKYIRERFKKIILDFKPDIIQVEQVFIYFGLKEFLKNINFNPLIVNSSQNIEYELKSEILLNTKINPEVAEKYKKLILEKEIELTKDSDLTIAVSEQDKDQFIKWGGKNIIIASNGINNKNFSNKVKLKWELFYKNKNINKFALFVGSAHPPNLYGLENMVGWGMGFLKYNQCITIAGSIGDYIKSYLRVKERNEFDLQAATFENRVINLCTVKEEELAALISLSEIIILPIDHGGGSNLKTAEAILSNKKIVATNHSFRGFENFKNLSGIYFADTKEDFITAIKKAFNDKPLERTKNEKELTLNVLWENNLSQLINTISKI